MALPSQAKQVFNNAANFINERSPQEKKMILVLGVCLILVADYWLVLNPLITSFTKVMPQLNQLKQDKKTLKEDKKNERIIKKDWQAVKEKVDAMEKSFISSDELPVLLENLSKLASESQVKIISLKPMEAKNEKVGSYKKTPIKIEASAGTHAFGAFLAKLETGTAFYRVTNLTITGDVTGGSEHGENLDLEAYQKE